MVEYLPCMVGTSLIPPAEVLGRAMLPYEPTTLLGAKEVELGRPVSAVEKAFAFEEVPKSFSEPFGNEKPLPSCRVTTKIPGFRGARGRLPSSSEAAA